MVEMTPAMAGMILQIIGGVQFGPPLPQAEIEALFRGIQRETNALKAALPPEHQRPRPVGVNEPGRVNGKRLALGLRERERQSLEAAGENSESRLYSNAFTSGGIQL